MLTKWKEKDKEEDCSDSAMMGTQSMETWLTKSKNLNFNEQKIDLKSWENKDKNSKMGKRNTFIKFSEEKSNELLDKVIWKGLCRRNLKRKTGSFNSGWKQYHKKQCKTKIDKQFFDVESLLQIYAYHLSLL